jgi:hypothetical protein
MTGRNGSDALVDLTLLEEDLEGKEWETKMSIEG